MREPTVAAVMLCSPGREEFQRQAAASFNLQKYQNRHIVAIPAEDGVTIGAMRNKVNERANGEIIVHFDDDDWSHPNRIAEQVALLQVSGADCVGYNEMLFWREDRPWLEGATIAVDDRSDLWRMKKGGEAWLYSNPNPRYALGTSLCYWRRAWEARPFQCLQHGEDTEWIRGLHCHAVSSFDLMKPAGADPRMIARIHSGNSSSAYDPIEMARHNALPRAERQWSRAAEWDKVCRGAMECV